MTSAAAGRYRAAIAVSRAESQTLRTRETQPAADSVGDLHALIASWAPIWKVPGLEARVRIGVSRRFRASIGRYELRRKTIRLAHWLLEADTALLTEVLCHEAAHATVYEMYGRRCAPHGAEWKALMRAAGYEPRVRLPEAVLPAGLRNASRPQALWVQRCPVCDAQRATRRRMPSWRCLACVKRGRDGRLEIARTAP